MLLRNHESAMLVLIYHVFKGKSNYCNKLLSITELSRPYKCKKHIVIMIFTDDSKVNSVNHVLYHNFTSIGFTVKLFLFQLIYRPNNHLLY